MDHQEKEVHGPCFFEQSYIVMPCHLNGENRLYGGQLLSWIDITAGLCARRYCGKRITTACVDRLDFLSGAYLNDTVVLAAEITYVGKTSMEVMVRTYVEKMNGERSLINTAYLVEVALSEDGKTAEVPAYQPDTPELQELWEKGRLRYYLRKGRKKSGI